MPGKKKLKAKSSFDRDKRRSEAAAFFISLKGLRRDNKAIRVNYTVEDKKKNTKKIRVLMVCLAVVMAGVLGTGVYFAVQEFQKLGPPSVPVNASNAGSLADASSAADPNDHLVVLGNWQSKIAESFTLDLTEIDGIQVDSKAAVELRRMISDAGEETGLAVEQGYLSDDIIRQQYEDAVSGLTGGGMSQAKAESEAMKTAPPPGQNEWGTGLLVQFQNPAPDADFTQSAAYKWLNLHSVDYGFVLRYPQNKDSDTGVSFHPQVYRFVGLENAKKMRALDLCVEEYAKYIKEQKAGY